MRSCSLFRYFLVRLTDRGFCGYTSYMPQDDTLRQLREHAVRLTKALYRVSERFPEHEPLRRHCREYADEILALTSAWSRKKPMDGIAGRIDALRNLLLIAAETGWVHAINSEVLIREYTALRNHAEQAFLWDLQDENEKKEEMQWNRQSEDLRDVLDVPAAPASMTWPGKK